MLFRLYLIGLVQAGGSRNRRGSLGFIVGGGLEGRFGCDEMTAGAMDRNTEAGQERDL